MSVTLLGTRGGGEIRPPVEYADAVEMYARQYGRHATMKFVPPPVNCWVVEFSLRSNDPRMKLSQQQLVEEEPKEVIYLWREVRGENWMKDKPRFVGYRLEELGVTGVIALLEKTNTWGRGEYRSHAEAAKDQEYKAEKARERIEETHRREAVARGMDRRRQALEIPFLPVGIELPKTGAVTEIAPKE